MLYCTAVLNRRCSMGFYSEVPMLQAAAENGESPTSGRARLPSGSISPRAVLADAPSVAIVPGDAAIHALTPAFAHLASARGAPRRIRRVLAGYRAPRGLGDGCAGTRASAGYWHRHLSYVIKNNPVTDMTIPEGFCGSCVVNSPGGDVVAFVQMRFIDTSEAAAYEAIPAGAAERRVSVLPLVAKRLENGFATAVTVQNLNEAAAATVDVTYIPAPEYVDAGGSPSPLVFNDVEVPAGGSLIHNHRITSGPNAVEEMPEGWYGTMKVDSEVQPIHGFVQLTFLRSINPSLPGGDSSWPTGPSLSPRVP